MVDGRRFAGLPREGVRVSEEDLRRPELPLELPGQPLHERPRGVVPAPVGRPPLAEYVRVHLQVENRDGCIIVEQIKLIAKPAHSFWSSQFYSQTHMEISGEGVEAGRGHPAADGVKVVGQRAEADCGVVAALKEKRTV